MSSLNKVQLIGNLGRDPEIRRMQSGTQVANFSVACNEIWKDKHTGEKKESVEWVNVVVFSEPLVKVIEQYVKKGSRIYIEGKLKTRKWQHQDGSDRYSTEVVLNAFQSQLILLDSRSGDRDNERGSAAEQDTYGSHRRAPAAAPAAAPSTRDDLNDAIPFLVLLAPFLSMFLT